MSIVSQFLLVSFETDSLPHIFSGTGVESSWKLINCFFFPLVIPSSVNFPWIESTKQLTMLSLRHFSLTFCKEKRSSCVRHLTHFASSQSNNVGNDSKALPQSNPSVSSYYKVNNQSAIDTAAGKVILYLINITCNSQSLSDFYLAFCKIDTIYDPILWKKSWWQSFIGRCKNFSFQTC